jgi:hypothetical protein
MGTCEIEQPKIGPLKFASAQSWFVVFRKKAAAPPYFKSREIFSVIWAA